MILLTFFFFNDTATTEIYTLSLHDALPISRLPHAQEEQGVGPLHRPRSPPWEGQALEMSRSSKKGPWVEERLMQRSEEHTSELQSRQYLVCRLLLEKKKKVHLT